MEIQVKTGQGWSKLLHLASDLPDGFLASAYDEGGFMLSVMTDDQHPAWLAVSDGLHKRKMIEMREGDGDVFAFWVLAGAIPNLRPDTVLHNDFVFQSVE